MRPSPSLTGRLSNWSRWPLCRVGSEHRLLTMKGLDWRVIAVLVLLSYVVSVSLTWPAGQQPSGLSPTRTPRPTFERPAPAPVARAVLPTSTSYATRTPLPPVTSTPTAPPQRTASATVTASPQPLPTVIPTPQIVTHTVQMGEVLLVIARRYGIPVQAIAEANDIANPDLIFPGQVLIIPLPTQPPATATPSARWRLPMGPPVAARTGTRLAMSHRALPGGPLAGTPRRVHPRGWSG